MAKKTKKTAKKTAKETAKKKSKSARRIATSARTTAKNAGKPVTSRMERAAAAATAGPSDEELDLRNRLKSGPRRQAGPPLSGDMPERRAMRALRDEVVTDPTDPKEP